MRQPALYKIAFVALACVLGANAFLLFADARLRREVSDFPKAQVWFPRSAAIPSGYLGNGLSYGPAATKADCFALLYTSANCSFCSAEMPAWRALVKRSRNLGCDALRIATYRGAESPGDTEQTEGRQVVFLNPGWVMGSPPRLIPALVIFARGASKAWCHVGELDPGAAQSAMAALSASAEAGQRAMSTATAAGSAVTDGTEQEERLTCR